MGSFFANTANGDRRERNERNVIAWLATVWCRCTIKIELASFARVIVCNFICWLFGSLAFENNKKPWQWCCWIFMHWNDPKYTAPSTPRWQGDKTRRTKRNIRFIYQSMTVDNFNNSVIDIKTVYFHFVHFSSGLIVISVILFSQMRVNTSN